jgi:hypothetical protein
MTSDPVKTPRASCRRGRGPCLRAEVDGALTLLDTQLADKRRDDLATVCAGTSHAFRFSDYARTPEGIALYGNTKPVRIHVFAETDQGQVLLGASPRPVSFAPAGLWDAGLSDGRWRTDFDNPLEGTAAAPLRWGIASFRWPYRARFRYRSNPAAMARSSPRPATRRVPRRRGRCSRTGR